MITTENPVLVPARPAAVVAGSRLRGLALGQLLVDVDDVVLNIALPSIVARDAGLSQARSLGSERVPALLRVLLLGGRLADRQDTVRCCWPG